MSAAEYEAWRVYWKINPKTEHRADLRNAMLMQLLHTANKGKAQPSAKVADFMPYDIKRFQEQGAELDGTAFKNKWSAVFKSGS